MLAHCPVKRNSSPALDLTLAALAPTAASAAASVTSVALAGRSVVAVVLRTTGPCTHLSEAGQIFTFQ